MLRFIRWTASGLILLLAIGWGVVWLAGRDPDGAAGRLVQRLQAAAGGPAVAGAPPGGTSMGGPFTLVDQAGHAVTEATFRGRWMLVYFGYTYCPDVCPTELQTISAALDQLGADAGKVAPLFVSIDPARDTPAVMADYVKLFDDRIVGLTGSDAQIAEIARKFHVYYAKVPEKDGSSYLMDHSSFLYLMGPDGAFRTLLRPGGTADAMAAAIETQLHQSS